MKRKSGAVLSALLIGLSVQSAHAAGGDVQSSGTVTITVEIPPFAAGLAAQAEGAVGLWTMVDNQSTLMIKLPDSISRGGADVEAAVFTPASAPFSVSVLNAGMKVAPQQTRSSNGLIRHGFTLRHAEIAALADGRRDDTATLIIAGV